MSYQLLKRFLCYVYLLAAVGVPFRAMAQVGYVYAGIPSAGQYEPDPDLSFNPAGGRIIITRSGPGTYNIQFLGLGGKGPGGGIVQVEASGTPAGEASDYVGGSAACKVRSWRYFAPDFLVRVACFTSSGDPVDTWFSLLAGWPNGSGGAGAVPQRGLTPIDDEPLPPGGPKTDASASLNALQTQVNAQANQIEALHRVIEELRKRVNVLSQ